MSQTSSHGNIEVVNSPIGGLSGGWSLLFRTQLALSAFIMPFIIAWAVWVTSQIFEIKNEQVKFHGDGQRYTAEMAAVGVLQAKEEILREVSARFPPPWLRQKVESLDARIDTLDARLSDHLLRHREPVNGT